MTIRFLSAALLGALLSAPLSAQPVETSAAAEPSWQKAVAEIAERAQQPGVQGRARNIILFIGDGMGISTITAARIHEAQARAKAAGGSYDGFAGGEENLLSFERLPHRALVKTYNTDAQVPDSAGTASAITTGTKTRMGVLGLLPGQGLDACAKPEQLPATLGRLARDRGMGLGIVTTTRITHATPAAMFAHTPIRDWEAADRRYPAEARKAGCADIADQLISFKGGADVVLGGGLSRFRPATAGGVRDDGRDLIAEWRQRTSGGHFVSSAKPFRALDPAAESPVFGLFNADHLAFNFDADRTQEPSLAEMTGFAIRKLEARAQRTGQGYVLMVEAGRIDHAHHMTNAFRALDETVELSKAVTEALQQINLDETLLLVTADHSHVFTMAGYPARGNPILSYLRPVNGGAGFVKTDADGHAIDQLGRPVPTLGYANGPAEIRTDKGVMSSDLPPTDPNYLQPKTFRMASETHGGEDVALFAAGPASALASGTIEQNSIFHIITHALGWR